MEVAMKVLLQEWTIDGKSETSISKDQTQLNDTIQEIEAESDEGNVKCEELSEVEVPNDHAFAEMVQSRTVFLHDDEMDVII